MLISQAKIVDADPATSSDKLIVTPDEAKAQDKAGKAGKAKAKKKEPTP
jgi:hypothetical protein